MVKNTKARVFVLMLRKGVSAALLFILLESSFGQTNLFVDYTNTGTENGSAGSPYRTINAAAIAANEGDSITIRQGTYREHVIIGKNKLTFKNYKDEKVTISGADIITNWIKVKDDVYKAYMPWNVTEGNQSNQVFLDSEMMQLSRWPENTGTIVLPANAFADDVLFEGENTVIFDSDFKAGSGKWDGSQIWINFSRTINNYGWDGQGWTGKVLATFNGRIIVQGKASARIGDQPWGMGPNLEYYLFNPLEAAVIAKGGISNYLNENEWWKKGDSLFVRLPAGQIPATAEGQSNLIEAKKRIWGFSPDPLRVTIGNTSIIGFDLFAASITTDLTPLSRASEATNAVKNLIDGINARYITHFVDQAGDYQVQWDSKSGIILSGVNSTIQNCTIQYSAAAAICVMGKNNRVLNNLATNCNYASTETGVINTGSRGLLGQDHEIAYNTVSNTPQQAFSIERNDNSDKSIPGKARVHHNLIYDFMLKTHDSGGFDVFGIDGNWARWDHNVIYNSTNFLSIGMYCDFGRGIIMDHNLMWNVDRPIQINYRADLISGPFLIFNNTVLSDAPTKPGIQNGVGNFGPGFNVRNNISTKAMAEKITAPSVLANLAVSSASDYNSFFANSSIFDYSLKPDASNAIDQGEWVPFADEISGLKPDLGCYESGLPKWEAGAGKIKPEFVISDSAFFLSTEWGQSASWTFPVRVLPFSGFTGEIELKTGVLPEGISLNLSKSKVNTEESFSLTLAADGAVHVGIFPVELKGSSGIYTNTRTYIIEIPQHVSAVKIQTPDTVLTKGQSLQISAFALDQEGNSMRIQPAFTYSVSGGGSINSNGKYSATSVSESITIIAGYQGFTDTLNIKVIDVTSNASNSESLSFKTLVYPNPAKEEISLDAFFNRGGNGKWLIYDFSMQTVDGSDQEFYAGVNTLKINISGLKSGIYFLEIEKGGEKVFRKFIVK
jgi:hypothetical protein